MWSVIGHDDAVRTLDRSLAEGRVAHAYLFLGPAHVGKARLALDLAKALNCSGSQPPCGECRACRRIEAGHHPDVELVGVGGLCDETEHDHRRDSSKDIKICQVRRVERVIALRPFEGRMRVVIIDPAGALNAYAADALLKTLEEPPDQVTLMLLATDETALPETIVSRARRVTLGPLPAGLVREQLIQRGVDDERAELIARLAEGRMGWALSHATDEALLEERDRRLARLESLIFLRRAERMEAAATLAPLFAASRDDLYAYLDLWQRWLRDLLLLSEGCEELVASRDRLATLRRVADAVPVSAVVRALEAIHTCRQQLEDNANARLALEMLLLRLPRPVVPEEAG